MSSFPESTINNIESEKSTAVMDLNKPGNETLFLKKEILNKPIEEKIKCKKLSFRQTATSMKRANMATMGIKATRQDSVTKKVLPNDLPVPPKKPMSAATMVKKPVSVIIPPATTLTKPLPTSMKKPYPNSVPPSKVANLSRKLTLPKSPNFTSRLKQKYANKPAANLFLKPSVAPKVPAPSKSTLIKSENEKSNMQGIKKYEKKDLTVSETDASKRNSSTWMVPLTPEKTIALAAKGKSNGTSIAKTLAPRTPKIKPFARKSFTDAKVPRQLARSNSTVTIGTQSSLSRQSSAATARKESRFSQSLWIIPKEPTEK